MGRPAIETMLSSPSLSVKVLASLGKVIIDHNAYVFTCTPCERLGHVEVPAAYAVALRTAVLQDPQDPDSEQFIYRTLALCAKHALFGVEDITWRDK